MPVVVLLRGLLCALLLVLRLLLWHLLLRLWHRLLLVLLRLRLRLGFPSIQADTVSIPVLARGSPLVYVQIDPSTFV